MATRKKKEPAVQVEEMPAAVEELAAEQAEAARGGITIPCELQAPEEPDKKVRITPASARRRHGYHK